jgi:hypothetical protein
METARSRRDVAVLNLRGQIRRWARLGAVKKTSLTPSATAPPRHIAMGVEEVATLSLQQRVYGEVIGTRARHSIR